MPFNKEQVRLHNKLLTEINNNMEQGSSEYAAFRMHITNSLGGAGVLGRCKDMLDICRHLSVRGKLAVLNYDVLKRALLDSHNDMVATIIDDREVEIRAAATSTAITTAATTSTCLINTTSVAGAGAATRDVNTDSIQTEGSRSTPKRKVEGEGPESKPKRKFEENDIDPSDGRFVIEDGLGYYDTTGKTGFLLILNFTAGRQCLDRDISLLTDFFETTLKFDTVLVPRSETNQTPNDLTSDQVTLTLTAVRKYLKRNAEKYYCFMCIVLAHGDDGVFNTANGQYRAYDVRQTFCNESMQEFTGKPKIFIIQACQGAKEQSIVEIDDAADTHDNARNNKPQIDESDVIRYIPNDADILFVFATTPGYVVAADALEARTFLIQHMVSVFQQWYQQLHMEDMLITLRNEISRERNTLRPMMPYSWSTLTHRLRFVATAMRNWGTLSLQRPLQTHRSHESSVLIDSVLID